jgi:non-specific serine/threonine protein kinase
VAQICARLDGLPLAIELAAARLKAMSAEQILERLSDRYTLLHGGSRGAPTRQQSLDWSIEWSYDLCTPAERQLWARLSVFEGSFELEAAEDVCGDGFGSDQFVDLLSSLVDKSILIRAESDGVVCFRLLQTLRAFGRKKIEQSGEYPELRRRHRDWYQRLIDDAESEWFSPRQLYWFDRLERELPNLREALEFSLSEGGAKALGCVVALLPFWTTRGSLTEGHRLLDRVLEDAPDAPSADRAKALYGATLMAGVQGDLATATARVAEARALVEQLSDPTARAFVSTADGFTALLTGDLERGITTLEAAADMGGTDLNAQSGLLLVIGWAHELRGDLVDALSWYERVLALSQPHGETVYRTNALWSIGIAKWRLGEHDDGAQRLREGLRSARAMKDRRAAAACLEALAWIAAENDDPRFAVVLMGAADTMGRAVGSAMLMFPDIGDFHQQCEQRTRKALGDKEFDAARRKGGSLGFSDAVAYALGERA